MMWRKIQVLQYRPTTNVSADSNPPRGRGYSLLWPIRGGYARKGYLSMLQAYKRVGKSTKSREIGHLGI